MAIGGTMQVELNEAKAQAIGWLVSSIETDLPGYLAELADRASNYPEVADVLADWGKRLKPGDEALRALRATAKYVTVERATLKAILDGHECGPQDRLIIEGMLT